MKNIHMNKFKVILCSTLLLISSFRVTSYAATPTVQYVYDPYQTIVKLPEVAFKCPLPYAWQVESYIKGFSFSGNTLSIIGSNVLYSDEIRVGSGSSASYRYDWVRYRPLVTRIYKYGDSFRYDQTDWFDITAPGDVPSYASSGMPVAIPNCSFYFDQTKHKIEVAGNISRGTGSRSISYTFFATNYDTVNRTLATTLPNVVNGYYYDSASDTSYYIMDIETWTLVPTNGFSDLIPGKVYATITNSYRNTSSSNFCYEFFKITDTVPPTLNISSSNSNWCTTLNLTIDARDESGLQSLTVNGVGIPVNTTSYTITGNGTYTVVATDTSGNATTKSITISNIDRTLPTVSLTKSNNGWCKSLNINIAAADNVGIQSLIVNSVTIAPTSAYPISANGSYNVVAVDHAGNQASSTINISNIDKTAPTITATIDIP